MPELNPAMTFLFMFLYLLGFITGSAIGSFINMLTYRVHKKMPLGGRSYADATGKPLAPVDLIPVFSYVLFRGRSRTSGEKLPLYYPVVEFVGGLLGIGVFSVYFNPAAPASLPLFVLMLFFVMGMLFFASYDISYMQLPRKETLLFTAIILITVILLVQSGTFAAETLFPRLLTGLISAVAVFGLSRVKLTGLAANDAVLTAACAFLLGPLAFLLALLSGSLLGSILGIIISMRRRSLKTYVPYALVLAAGTLLVILFPFRLTA